MDKKIKRELKSLAKPEKATAYLRFFKTGPGEYGEGDKFLGITTPELKDVIQKYYKNISLSEVQNLLNGSFHEERSVALSILTRKFDKADELERKKIYEIYLSNTANINNWDLVDISAEYIVGPYIENKDRSVLYKLAKSENLWERRIAIISTFHFIKNKDNDDTFRIAEVLMNDKHDLIHKAVGWMLREVGKRSGEDVLKKFLDKHYKTMPRIMLRYSIEKFDDKTRKHYLAKS